MRYDNGRKPLLTQIAISLPFAVLRVHLLSECNPVGIEANAAYYGFGLMIYALFNVLFVTEFFRTAWKAGKAFLIALIPASLMALAMEVIVHFPGFGWLDSVAPADLVRQLPILAAGIAVYAAGAWVAYAVAARRFEKVDL